MNTLPQFQGGDQTFQLMQNSWGAILNPLLLNPTLQSVLLKNVSLINGMTTVNHKLGRKLQGWKIVRQRAAASVYDAQDANQMPDLTLVLISNAAVVIDLECF